MPMKKPSSVCLACGKAIKTREGKARCKSCGAEMELRMSWSGDVEWLKKIAGKIKGV